MAPRNGPQRQRALIQKYNIFIDGPVQPEVWPERYFDIFSLVRSLENVRYQEYFKEEPGVDDRRRVNKETLRAQVDKLVCDAFELRRSLDNEDTWRLKTENLVFERFEADVDCHVCSKRLWVSDTQAAPSCRFAAERLKAKRDKRSLCICSEVAKAKLLSERSVPHFVTKVNCPIVDMSMPEIQEKVLTRHKPDRVIGLKETTAMRDLLEVNRDIAAGVTKGVTDLLFPFLVLEAKREKDAPGFESIERQTAFPIRAMVNIQKALETASTAPIDPLVWFLASRGDEWRLYGCIPDLDCTRIIDLWHGCVLRHDSALQLFLIIDMLCDWARDIYTEQVLSCLRKRAESTFSDTGRTAHTIELPSSPDAWKEHVALMSNEDVQVQFRHISLPESTEGLFPLLQAIGRGTDIINTARRLLTLFRLEDPFIIGPDLLQMFHQAWGQCSLDKRHYGSCPQYASLSWRAGFDYADWVLTKELSCITASKTAMATLVEISRTPIPHPIPDGDLIPTRQGHRLLHPVRYLPLAELVHSASRNQFLHLHVHQGKADPSGWTEDHRKGIICRQLWDSPDYNPDAFSHCSQNIYTNIRGRSQSQDDVKVPLPLQIPGMAKERPIALLKMPDNIEGGVGQVYCIFVLDSLFVGFFDEIGTAILEFLRDGHSCFYGSNVLLTAADRRNLAVLGNVLQTEAGTGFV